MIQEVGRWKADQFPRALWLLWESFDYKSTVTEEKGNTAAVLHTNSTSETLIGRYEEIAVVIKKQLILSDVEEKFQLSSNRLKQENLTVVFPM